MCGVRQAEFGAHARLQLVRALKQVIGNGLRLLGVSAPERMTALPEAETEG